MSEGIIIKYVSDQNPSTIGNTACHVKPVITLNYDNEGNKGVFGFIMNKTIVPSMEYQQIYVKYDSYVDVSVGGLLTLDGTTLIDDDIIWLTNQGISGVNGLYFARSGTWDFYRSVTSSLFIDLGARSIDKIDGDISRDIITQHNIDFTKVGIYTITYYSLNSNGILANISRKLKLTELDASLVSTDTYAISDYKITAEFDASLFV